MGSIAKKLASIILLIFCIQYCYAQFGMGSTSDFKGSQDRTLIVVTETENPDVITKLHDKHMDSLVTVYQNAIKLYNDNMKTIVEKYWKVNTKIIYMTPGEVETAYKANSNNELVLYCATISTNSSGKSFSPDHGMMNWSYKDVERGNLSNTAVNQKHAFITLGDKTQATFMLLRPIEHLHRSFFVFKYGFYRLLPNQTDIVSSVQAINWELSTYLQGNKMSDEHTMINQNHPYIKGKTLLIPEELIDPKLSVTQIKNFYPFNYKVVSIDSISNYIDNNTPGYEYANISVAIAGSQEKIDLQYFVIVNDCETGKTMSVVLSGGGMVGMTLMGGMKTNFGYTTITENALKTLASQAAETAK
jgi:hypothetical protein